MAYEFDRQRQQGVIGELAVDRFFSAWGNGLLCLPAGPEAEKRGIDRYLAGNLSVEVKTDWLAASTGNAFVETVSSDTTQTPGWVFTCQADLLLYYIPQLSTAMIVRAGDLRQRIGAWQKNYPNRAVRNKGYCTHGILVPLDEIRKLSLGIFNIPLEASLRTFPETA
jgi:hypothetical protein